MSRRSIRLAAALASATLAMSTTLGTSTVATSAPPEGPSISLWAPERVVAYSYGGEVYSDLGFRLVAENAPFEIWSTRPSYDDQIVSVWKSPAGDVTLPEGSMAHFSGLDDFVKLTIRRVSDGEVVERWRQNGCLNGNSQRIRPDAPARSPYPWGCPWNPYTLGSVMGIEQGYATSMLEEWYSLTTRPGRYDVTASIAPAYRTAFGMSVTDSERTTRLVVKRARDSGFKPAAPRSDLARPAAQEPAGASGGRVAGPTPDIRSLPAFDINLNRGGTVLRFSATTWNAGDSPLVVDGFRSEGEEHMDAYQYFFDTDGNQTGYQEVGEMHWHEANHQHWHFEDFARYRLMNADMSEAVKSTKQSWCLANTDAVDYTRPAADWQPENTDLGSSCGGHEALSLRQVLAAGSGDTYSQYRAGQAFRIHNVPNGVYYLAVEGNPVRNLVESDYDNNDSFRKIRIGGSADNRWVRVPQVGIIDEFGGFFRNR